jgi:MOSC domain-containing protein YiiM
MQVVSVNVGLPRELERGGRSQWTAIDRQPAAGAVQVGELGLAGDAVGDTRHHGGRDQAVYVYTTDDAAHFEGELGRPVRPGEFGENLTLSGLSSADLAVGDRLLVGGDVELEVTAPRIPCGTFAHQMQQRGWVKRFLAAGLPGAYTRVHRTGAVAAGDAVRHVPAEDRSLPVVALLELAVDATADLERVRAALRHPVAERARRDLERRLATV